MCTTLPLTAIYLYSKFHFNPFVLSKIWPGQSTIMKNGHGEIIMQINRVGLWFLGVLPFPSLSSICIYIKFYLNANSSFKVICQTRYRQRNGCANIAYCELFGWYRCVYELTKPHIDNPFPNH